MIKYLFLTFQGEMWDFWPLEFLGTEDFSSFKSMSSQTIVFEFVKPSFHFNFIILTFLKCYLFILYQNNSGFNIGTSYRKCRHQVIYSPRRHNSGITRKYIMNWLVFEHTIYRMLIRVQFIDVECGKVL